MSRSKWAGGLSSGYKSVGGAVGVGVGEKSDDGGAHRAVHVLLVQVDVARDELVLVVRERRLQLKGGAAYGARCNE